ncbi:hypothetical protein P1J78_22060 [Psychromarinibacter sp. C21-152]|uniref:Uncharacterized protein n=1 Tax=Psychromarinibacter sediminicola TaxID=3033385 RepID=A0AAE3NYV3_9RHOB|nr:hypothetical protein [Psychromarinibacter sediminicola]MDF0603420.1 hypothetical protein [Psychromarinibacter sediminicola]
MTRLHNMLATALALAMTWAGTAPAAAEVRPIPDTCVHPAVDPIPLAGETGFGPWRHRMAIEHHRGLIYRDITAAGEHFLDSFHVAFLELTFETIRDQTTRYVRFCGGDDRIVADGWDAQSQMYTFAYEREFRERDIRGDFRVEYRTKYGVVDRPCAGRPGVGESAFARNCARWVPVLEYSWFAEVPEDPQAAILTSVRAYYRIDYGQAALVLIKDPNWALQGAWSGAGLHPILQTETSFDGLIGGVEADFDNIHPAYPTPGRRTVVVPGCRSFAFDCTHLHWRWGGQWNPPLDPLVEPETGATVPGAKPGGDYLSPGHTIRVHVAADKGEGDVLNPDALIDGDALATADKCRRAVVGAPVAAKLDTIENPVVVWMVIESDKPSDTFFRWGFFGLEPLRHVKENLGLAALDNVMEFYRQSCDPYFAALLAEIMQGNQP